MLEYFETFIHVLLLSAKVKSIRSRSVSRYTIGRYCVLEFKTFLVFTYEIAYD